MGVRAKLNDCKKSVIQKDVLENLIIDTTIQVMSRPHIIEYAIQSLLELQEKKFKANTALNSLLKEQKQNETALQNLVTAIENGIISNTTNKRLHELEQQAEDIERRILIEKSKNDYTIHRKGNTGIYHTVTEIRAANAYQLFHKRNKGSKQDLQ